MPWLDFACDEAYPADLAKISRYPVIPLSSPCVTPPM